MNIVDSGVLNASEQMRQDQMLIEALDGLERPLVRLWRFEKKSITYGYFQKIHNYVDCEKAQSLGYDIAKRPTGGGALFHTGDFSFTIAIPAHHRCFSNEVLENYRLVNETLLDAVVSAGAISMNTCSPSSLPCTLSDCNTPYSQFCMASPSKYDLLWQGKKIGGASQRKTKFGFVHQGSLFLHLPDFSEVRSFLLDTSEALEHMKSTSCALLKNDTSQNAFDTFYKTLTHKFLNFLSRRL